jgi:dihydroxy-acid dehydratase
MADTEQALEPGTIPPEPLSRREPASLRSARWFGPADLRSFGHRSRAMQMGYAPEEWQGKPVIAIINTWSDLQPCHAHFKTRVELRQTNNHDVSQHAGDGNGRAAALPPN